MIREMYSYLVGHLLHVVQSSQLLLAHLDHPGNQEVLESPWDLEVLGCQFRQEIQENLVPHTCISCS